MKPSRRRPIRIQSDFDKQMNAWQYELREIMLPIKTKEDELMVEIGKLNVKKSELTVQYEDYKEQWASICEKKDIREEKLSCLAMGRALKAIRAKTNAEIQVLVLELRQLRQKRKQLAQPFHDKMHELIVKYPKGSLPLVAR